MPNIKGIKPYIAAVWVVAISAAYYLQYTGKIAALAGAAKGLLSRF